MDSLQLLTPYLTLTPIFSGRKANINLHTMPKLTVVVPISCLLRCICFPGPKMMGSPLACLFSCNFVVCFQSSPAIKSFLELTDCCLVYQTFFAICLCFLQSLKKESTISFAGGHFFFFPSRFDRGCFSSPMLTNDVISEDVTIVHILINTHVKFFRLSLCKNEILVSKM